MKKCLIWGLSDEYNSSYNQLLFESFKGNLSIETLISKDKYADYIDGKKVIDKSEISLYEFDYLIVFNKLRFLSIKNEAIELGIPKKKILDGRIFAIPCFDFKRYCELIENPLTIISDDCWGGMVSNYLALEFNSPFVNLFISSDDYIKLLENINYYLQQELCMVSEGDVYSCTMPIGSLGEGNSKIIIDFNHHVSFIDAKNDWERRIGKINRNNLLIKMTLPNNDESIAKRFNELPFKNKVCFCPKQLDYESTVFLPRYIWRSTTQYTKQGSTTFGVFLRDMDYMSKCCDILRILCGNKDFVREN
jgi:uncharacterized protein (DUF1919 family)